MLPSIDPIILAGRHMVLHPLDRIHGGDLAVAIAHGELWRSTLTSLPAPSDIQDYIGSALQEQKAGRAIPFAIIDRISGRAVGSTRYANIRREHRSIEIGWTWLGQPWQRTAINTEAKYHLLCHAFDKLRCIRVELKTDVLNERSRCAIERIGGVQEGIFRKHMIMPDGRFRDTVYYSIIDLDWPITRARLEARLNKSSNQPAAGRA